MIDKKLMYFLSAARNLSFTKAAGENYVAQTAVSQQIKNFEDELGFELFERDSTGVKLTPAGEYLYPQVQHLLAQYNAAIGQARRIASIQEDSIRIGFLSTYEQGVITPFVRDFHVKYPEIEIHVMQGDKQTLVKKLLSNALDILIVLSFDLDHLEALDILNIVQDKCVFLLGPHHPLAGRDKIAAHELAEETIIVSSENNLKSSDLRIRNYLEEFGLANNKIVYTENFYSMTLMVQTGLGIAMVPSGLKETLRPGFQFTEIEGVTKNIDLAAVRLKGISNPSSELFFQMLKKQRPNG